MKAQSISAAERSSDLTVIVPTWNGKELLRRCLKSLQAQTVRCDVLVVDNGSGDDTDRMLATEFPRVTALRLAENAGFAGAVNQGIRQAKTGLIALLNNDTEVDDRWAEVGLEAAKKWPDFAIFASRMMNARARDRLDSAGDCYSRTGLPTKRGGGQQVSQYLVRRPVLGACAGAAFYRRTLFDQIGLFDEDYGLYLEDVEFSLRAQLHGFRCLYLPDAVVFHLEAASDPDRDLSADPTAPYYSARRVYWITRNRWQLMITYQPLRHGFHLTFGWMRSFAFHLLKAGFSKSFLGGLVAGVLTTPQAYSKRRKLKGSRTLSTGELCRLMREC